MSIISRIMTLGVAMDTSVQTEKLDCMVSLVFWYKAPLPVGGVKKYLKQLKAVATSRRLRRTPGTEGKSFRSEERIDRKVDVLIVVMFADEQRRTKKQGCYNFINFSGCVSTVAPPLERG